MKLNLAGVVMVFASAAILVSFGEEPRANTDAAPREEWASEVVTIKYERAADIAAALNGLTTHYHGLGTNPLASRRDAENVLSNAWANVSPQFKELNRRREANSGSEGVVGPEKEMHSGIDRIIADERTNAVLIYALKRDLKILKETIARLDTAREGILIEAVIFEVALNGTNSAEVICFGGSGSEWHALANGQSGYSKAFAPMGGTDRDFDAMITQLAEHKEVKILQRPRIQTADGVAASLFVGDSRYCPRTCQDEPGMRAEEGRHSMNELLGVTLDISPTITPERKLLMTIAQTIEKYAGSTNMVNVGTVPITSRQNLKTEVTVADRQTTVFAGPVEHTQDKPAKGIPVLKNTPLIGGFFRNHPRKMKVETLLAIRATILPQNHARASQEGTQRMEKALATNR